MSGSGCVGRGLTYAESEAWAERARRVIPGGGNTLSKRPGYAGPEGSYPAVAKELKNGYTNRVVDVDGNEFVDWTSGLGAAMCHGGGPVFSLVHTSEIELAERLVKILPGAEQVKFFSTGSEACMCAWATAREATGRQNPGVIITSDQSYHGWAEQFRAVKPTRPGVPHQMADWIATFKYNDLADLDRVLALYGTRVAAVMMEPALSEPPNDGFLEGVKAMAHAAGALLIFDEMLLGFRLAMGGGGEFFGVTPDLSVFGKPIGGGYPFSVLAGAERHMRHAAFGSGTFCGCAAVCREALAMLDRYERMRIIETLWDTGHLLLQAIAGAIELSGAPLMVGGYAVLPILKWGVPDPEMELHSLLQQELADRGVLIHASGRLLPTAAHDAEAIVQTARAFRDALEVVSDAYKTKTVGVRLRGLTVRRSGIRQPVWEVPA